MYVPPGRAGCSNSYLNSYPIIPPLLFCNRQELLEKANVFNTIFIFYSDLIKFFLIEESILRFLNY